MKKIVLTGTNRIEIQEAPIPVPGPGQAVVQIQCAGICGSDLHVYAGQHPTAKPPLVMGHEAVGRLYALNASRTDIQIGDKVCVHTVEPCRACENCCAGRENLCENVKIMGVNMDGVFTQYLLISADRIIRINDDVEDEIAALVEPLTVGVHDMKRAALRAGESVLISGAGPIGLILAIMAEFSGASKVVLSEIDPVRIEIARSFGYAVVNPQQENYEEECFSLSAGKGFDKVFEIAAVQSSVNTCIKMLKRGGTMIQVGMPSAGTVFQVDINKIIYSECDIRGVRHHTMADMQAAVNLLNSGKLNEKLRGLASAIYAFEDCEKAFARAREDKTCLRVLLRFAK